MSKTMVEEIATIKNIRRDSLLSKKVKKALLIFPPCFTSTKILDVNPLPPLGLAYIGAILEKRGVEVKIFDCLAEGFDKQVFVPEYNLYRIGSSFEEIKKLIEDFQPDMVGVNNIFSLQRHNAHEVYRITKMVNPEIITVAGGAHPTSMPELVISDGDVDFVVLGEGEGAFEELLEGLEGKKDFETIDGIGFQRNGTIRINPKTKFVDDVDALPFPARHLLNWDKYYGLEVSHGVRHRRKFSPIVTSRGCPAKCTFCSAYKVWGRAFRARSPENVIAEMKEMIEKFGIEEIVFEDDNLTLDPKRAERIFDLMVEEKLNLVWDTPNGVAGWTLTPELLEKMKASGCVRLNFPIESANPEVLKHIIRKPLKLEKVGPLVEHARKIKLPIGFFFVIGMPGETEDQIWDSYRFARKHGVYNPHVSIATPYPGTELYEIALKNNYLREGYTMDDLFIRSFPISTPEISREKLQQIFNAGQRYMLMSYIQDRPFEVMKKFIVKLFTNPKAIYKRFCQLSIKTI